MLCIPITVLVSRSLKEKTCRIDVAKSMEGLKGLKTVIFLEGAIDEFCSPVIPVLMLLYVKTEIGFGSALGYIAVVGLLASYLVAAHSDRKQKRIAYLVPLFLAMAASVLALEIAGSFVVWIALVTVFLFLETVSYPMQLALIMDGRKTDAGYWAAREVALNVGRFVTISIAAVLVYFSLYWAVFAMYAAIFAAYPFVARRKLVAA
jgi:hypothetical protein